MGGTNVTKGGSRHGGLVWLNYKRNYIYIYIYIYIDIYTCIYIEKVIKRDYSKMA